jgi:adenine-specific DNA-methyltransferase
VIKRKQKLELTWIGKENRPRLEPRILLEDPALSYHAAHRLTENDIFDNRLIFGGRLVHAKSVQSFAGCTESSFPLTDTPKFHSLGVPFGGATE